MYKKLLAVFAAAACAAVIVGFIPTPQPASAAKAPQANVVAIEKMQANAVDTERKAPVLAAPSTTCTQGWPHYDQNCLRDSRRPNGKARVARVVAIDRSAADHALRPRH